MKRVVDYVSSTMLAEVTRYVERNGKSGKRAELVRVTAMEEIPVLRPIYEDMGPRRLSTFDRY